MDIITFCEREQISAIVLLLDYLKAFDRAEVNSVIESMDLFEFRHT